jgi:hypothetical protein
MGEDYPAGFVLPGRLRLGSGRPKEARPSYGGHRRRRDRLTRATHQVSLKLAAIHASSFFVTVFGFESSTSS